eukprot:3937327-Rhodomonas_salina.3
MLTAPRALLVTDTTQRARRLIAKLTWRGMPPLRPDSSRTCVSTRQGPSEEQHSTGKMLPAPS